MIEAASRWEGGRDLGHAECYQQGEDHADRPDDTGGGSAHGANPELERSNPAGENANDGEGNGEIGKSAHPAQQLLRVAHGMEEADIIGESGVQRVFRGCFRR